MKYALLIYSAPTVTDDANVGDEVSIGWVEYTQALKDTGALIAVERLQPTDTATSVRLRDGERLVTDGPFIETKEHLLGFYLVDLPDLDAALDWAGRMPQLRHGIVEVRPIMPTPALAQIVAS